MYFPHCWLSVFIKHAACLRPVHPLTYCLCSFHQTQESLNPNNLEYWMEDVYTPGYDSLLKRKEAEFRRAKVCKIGALIAAATCTVILVIVVPICTMKTWESQDGVTMAVEGFLFLMQYLLLVDFLANIKWLGQLLYTRHDFSKCIIYTIYLLV